MAVDPARARERARQWRVDNLERAREVDRQRYPQRSAAMWALRIERDFGITADQYAEMLSAQGGVCAICCRPERQRRKGVVKRLAVDHCHATGRVRGLLCGSCNNLLGRAADDAVVLRRATEYLEQR